MMKSRLILSALAFVIAGALFAATPANYASANNYGHGGYGNGNVHCVSYGETLYSIGRQHGVSAYAIAQHNGLVNPNYVRAGYCLRIPAGYGHGGYGNGGHNTGHGGYGHGGYGHGGYGTGWHQVKHGETLYSIARWYGVSPYAIAKTNGLYNVNYIRAGQSLRIPGY